MTGQTRESRAQPRPNQFPAGGSQALAPTPEAAVGQIRDYRRGLALVLATSAGLWATLFLLLIGLN